MPDLRGWLTGFGLEPLAGVLADNDVDLDVLPDLTDQDLEKLGISLGHRRKLLKAIGTLAGPSAAATAAAEPERVPPVSPTPAATSEAERRQVTVLFSDLVGSTALATVLDPEDMSGLIRRYQDGCAGAIARFDGYIAKFMGDGVLAYFGYPLAREDGAECSVRAALAIVDAVGQIRRPDGLPLQTRVGIATGLVVVGDIIGSGAAREETIVGETPNLAARLQTLAEPNSVLVSEATYRLLGRVFEYENYGERPLKGFSKPVPVWRVLREAVVARRFEAARATDLGPFVGRKQEMGLLFDRWRLAQQREGQAILVTAEPGMGKSRLIEALFEQVGDEPHRKIVLQCSPYHCNTAFYPVIRQIEHAAGFILEDSAAQKIDKLETWLTVAGTSRLPMAPLLADLLSLPPDGRYQPLDLTPAQRKHAVISTLADQLVRLSEHRPLLFVLEDAHWIDPTTQEMLTRLIDSIERARIFVIATARPEFASPWSGSNHVGSLALSRLSKTQCAEIVASVASAQAVAADLLEEILAKTDGVPLFVEELARTVAEEPTANRLSVPATLQDSLMARLDRLGPAKETAQIAAAIGRQFAQALLAAVAPVDARELESQLARLTEARLVFPQTRAIEPTFRFKHALTRDVAYDSLLRARRQQLHERIARTLEERFPELAAAEPEILAHHFGLADRPAQACLYSERAGDRALTRFAYKEATAHFSAALRSAAGMPEAERAHRQIDVLLKLGPALGVVGGMQSAEAGDAYRRAAELAEALGDETALYKAKWGLWLNANLGRKTALARERASELVALAQRSGDEHLLLEAYHCRWSTAIFRGDVAAAIADGRLGIECYDINRHRHLSAAFGGHDPGACAHVCSGLALQMSGDRHGAKDIFGRGLALAEALNHPNSLAHALYNTATGYQIIGDRAGAGEAAQRALTLAEKFGLGAWRASSLMLVAWASATGSGVAEAARLVDAEIGNATAVGAVPQVALGLAAEVLLAAGRPAEGLAHVNRAIAAIDEPGVGLYLPEIYRLRGLCLLALNREAKDEARHAFIAARDVAKMQGATIFVQRAEARLAEL